MTVAMNDGTGLQYLLTDHLGSVVAITDNSGTLTSQQRYLPFGQVRTDLNGPRITQTDFGYTGQRALSVGLMDYKARMYDPYLLRWSQPDMIVAGRGSQSFNRYSYVGNNSINRTDPSGYICASMANYQGRALSDDECYYGQLMPTGLNGAGVTAWYGMNELKRYGKTRLAMEFVVSTEYAGSLKNPAYVWALGKAMTNRFYSYCGSSMGGAWSASCLNNFWGYMAGVLQAADPDNAKRLNAAADSYNNDANQNGTKITNAILRPDGDDAKAFGFQSDWYSGGCNHPWDPSPTKDALCEWAIVNKSINPDYYNYVAPSDLSTEIAPTNSYGEVAYVFTVDQDKLLVVLTPYQNDVDYQTYHTSENDWRIGTFR